MSTGPDPSLPVDASGGSSARTRGHDGPPRRRERPRMVSIAPHAPVTTEDAVHRASEPDGQAGDAAPEAIVMVGFDDEVCMVRLDGELDDAKPVARGSPDGVAE